MKVIRNTLAACGLTLAFSGSAFAGIMQTGCASSGAGDSTGLAFGVLLNVVHSIIALI